MNLLVNFFKRKMIKKLKYKDLTSYNLQHILYRTPTTKDKNHKESKMPKKKNHGPPNQTNT